ncbi:MAG: tetratricopeptide repeat protein [Deltaproteobacteria bacterium]|nr:tetratricopeptide repeat protein [Deltaproteobacteria bacterium]
MKLPTIAACMIVRNEEKLLPACLKSIRDYVDELVIVDTGSTDDTIKIAESFGARVYHHPWENHFSKHRNQSLAYAQSDWILVIDADEELMGGSGPLLREAVRTAEGIDGIAAIVECAFGHHGASAYSNSIRVIRSNGKIHYKGRVHNYLVGVKRVLWVPIRIYHHGYVLDRETQLKKFKRTVKLLKRDIQEDPSNPRPHHFLAASYLSENMYKEGALEARKAIDLYEKNANQSHNYLWSLYIATSCYLELGDIEAARKLAEKGVNICPDSMDLHYTLAIVAYKMNNRTMFHQHMDRYLNIKRLLETDPARFGQMVHHTGASQWWLYLLKGFFMMQAGEEDKASEAFKESKAACPNLFLYHSNLAVLYVQCNRFLQAAAQYRKALDMNPTDTRTMWALSYAYKRINRFSDQAKWLEKILEIDPGFPHARFQLGLAYMQLGNFESALATFQKVQQQDPNNRLAKINEALCLRGLARYESSIRLSETIEPSSDAEKQTLVSNLAACHYELGNRQQSIDAFIKLSEIKPTALEPPVYLSKLLMEKGDLKACLTQCNKLLTLLDIPEDRTANSAEKLGAFYIKAAKELASKKGNQELVRMCFELGAMLGRRK